MKKVVFTIVAVALLFTGCGAKEEEKKEEEKPVVSKEQTELVNIQNDFTFSLLSRLYNEDNYTNTSISGLSAHIALCMVANGAASPCLEEILTTIGLDGLDIDKVNQTNNAFLFKKYGEDITITNSNSMWVTKDTKVAPEFADKMSKMYGAKTDVIDFSDEKSPDTINGWVAKSTNNKISKLVNYDEIKDALMLLLNALYLKAPWTTQFDPEATSDMKFTLLDGKPKNVKMMSRESVYKYHKGEGFQIVRIPYGKNEELAMYVVLPESLDGLINLVQMFDRKTLDIELAKMKEKPLQFKMPKINFEYETNLIPTLKKMGMNAVFDPSTSNLSNMIVPPPEAFISLIKHKVFMDVNEGGTEAAAVTSIGMVGSAAPGEENKPDEFICDHPYMFLIRDEVSGQLLFASCAVNP